MKNIKKYPVKVDSALTLAGYHEKYKESVENPDGFWLTQSKSIDWIKEPTIGLEGDFSKVNHTWFRDGILNASYNCIDRHLATRGNQDAIIWAKDEPGEYQRITYNELHDHVGKFANLLRDLGVKKGDRVCIYLPMVPELVYSLLACARIGAIHSVVFAGFSAEALRGRIDDTKSELVITANEGLRGGRPIALKKITDAALMTDSTVKKVLVIHRTETKVEMVKNRDLVYEDLISKYDSHAPCEPMNSIDPLFILYTSGSTGKPKGIVHGTGGYLTYAQFTHREVFGLRENDVFFCTADVGWVTGHSYVVYGPLSNGATTVLFESTPSYPDNGRLWNVVEDLKVNIIYTAPTALRSLALKGDGPVKKYDRSSLRILGTVGEPINPETWQWYHDVVGEKKCDVIDTWWQTETGGHLISPIAGVTPAKPGSATLPVYGVEPIIVNPETGAVLEGNNVEGALCIRSSWPGQALSIYGDHQRFIETYFTQYKGLYFTGDGVQRDEDGYYWITGRIDDVLNVSGHRLGTAEIESALMEHKDVAEAAVVGMPHDIKGVGIYAYVILFPHAKMTEELIESIKDVVRNDIGRFATPDIIHITSGLPKTRSGKVMRRILRKIAAGEHDSLGDISTLSDPSVVETLLEEYKELKK